jgi:hypothetical protein
MSNSPQNRKHFRLRYPLPSRPRLIVNGLPFQVTEISESGSKVLLDAHDQSNLNGDPEGVFCFHDETSIKVVVSFVRMAEDEVVLKLTPPIPLQVIMAEQRWILSQYPKESLR